MPFEPWKEETPDAPVQQQEEAPSEPVAAAPEPAPAPETARTEAREPQEHKRTDDAIPLAKALEWRNQWRDTERRLGEAMERLKALEQPKAPEPKLPDYQEDPVEHLRVKQEMAESRMRTMEQQQQALRAAAQREQARIAAMQGLTVARDEFAKATPDYGDAVNYLTPKLAERYLQNGVPEQMLSRALEEWQIQVGMHAQALGINPAALAYDIARRMGYEPKPSAPAPQASTDKVASIAEAKERSKSLGPSRAETAEPEEDDDMGGLKTLFEAQAEMGLRRRK